MYQDTVMPKPVGNLKYAHALIVKFWNLIPSHDRFSYYLKVTQYLSRFLCLYTQKVQDFVRSIFNNLEVVVGQNLTDTN